MLHQAARQQGLDEEYSTQGHVSPMNGTWQHKVHCTWVAAQAHTAPGRQQGDPQQQGSTVMLRLGGKALLRPMSHGDLTSS